ncbi:MAG: NFACT family protein [Desulfurococcaceae archaeon]|nr:NFACT family protein [Desulfurococcaceae archaeon]
MSSAKPKEVLTSIDLAVVLRELGKLSGCSVRNVYVPLRDLLVLELRCGDDVLYLVAEAGRRIHVSRHIFTTESLGVARQFRKFLDGARLVGVGQLGLERVAVLEFESGGRRLKLYVELLPRGIIALVDGDGRVLAVNRGLKVRDREVRPGTRYVPPPAPTDILRASPEDVVAAARGFSGNLAQFLVRVFGIPPEVVNEVLDPRVRTAKVAELGTDVVLKYVDEVREFIRKVLESPRPCLIISSGRPVGFLPFTPSRVAEGLEVVEYKSMNQLVEEYFRELSSHEQKQAELARIKEEEARVSKTLEEAESELRRLEEYVAAVSRELELFERNYHVVEEIWGCCRRAIKDCGWGCLERCGPVEGNPSEGSVLIRLPDGELKLLVYKDLVEQYSELRGRYVHLTEKYGRARAVVEELKRRLDELARRRVLLEALRVRPRRVSWFSRFLWVETSSGFLAIGGRDASQNEVIVRRYLGPRDIFMHADIHGAAVFVILTQGREVGERDLYEVATLAASYSKAWKAGLASVDVFWVYGDQVKLAAPPGQYLPRGSFMVYGQRNYIRGVKLRLGIGVAYYGDTYDIVIGPPELVASRAVAWVEVVPGNLGIDEISKEIRGYLVERCPDVRGLTVNNIAKLIPGRASIVRKG